MSSPFAAFRRHQKVLLVVLVGLSMLSFVIFDAIQNVSSVGQMPPQLMVLTLAALVGAVAWVIGINNHKSSEYGFFGLVAGAALGLFFAYQTRNADVAVRSSEFNLSDGDLGALQRSRSIANRFVASAIVESHPELPPEQLNMVATMSGFGFGLPDDRNRQDVVLGELLRVEARRLGMNLPDSAVMEYVSLLTSNHLTREAFRKIRTGLGVSESELIDSLRKELLAREASELLYPRVAIPPAINWEFSKQLQLRENATVAAVPISAFVDSQAQPTPQELQQLFDKHRENYPNVGPDGKSQEGLPGFRQPPRVKIGYLIPDYLAFEREVQPTITDAMIEARYQEDYVNPAKVREGEFIPDAPSLTPPGPSLGPNPGPAQTPDATPPAAETTPPAATPETSSAPPVQAPPATGKEPPMGAAPAEAAPGAAPTEAAPGAAKEPPAAATPAATTPPATETPPTEKAPAGTENDGSCDDPPPAESGAAPPTDAPPASTPEAPAPESNTPPTPAATTPAPDAPTPAAPGPDGKSPSPETATPPAAEGATPPPASAETPEKAPSTPPVGDAETPPPLPSTAVPPLDDELKAEIRDQLLMEGTNAAIKQAMTSANEEIRNKIGRYISAPPIGEPKWTVEQATQAVKDYAAAHHFLYSETDFLSQQELLRSEDHPIGAMAQPQQGNPFASVTVADILFSLPLNEQFQPHLVEQRDQGGRISDRAIYWKLGNQPPYVPEDMSDERIHKEVERTWRDLAARDKAKTRADALADIARKSGKPLVEALGTESITGQPETTLLNITQTGQFQWVRQNIVPSMDFRRFEAVPEQSQIPGLEPVGSDFMRIVFDDLKTGDVGVAPSVDRSVYYVVRIDSRIPSDEEQWNIVRNNFLAGVYDQSQQRLAAQLVGSEIPDWREELYRKYQVQFLEEVEGQ